MLKSWLTSMPEYYLASRTSSMSTHGWRTSGKLQEFCAGEFSIIDSLQIARCISHTICAPLTVQDITMTY